MEWTIFQDLCTYVAQEARCWFGRKDKLSKSRPPTRGMIDPKTTRHLLKHDVSSEL